MIVNVNFIQKGMMQNAAKIQLSKEETELLNSTEFFLTKHRIIKKVYEMFGEVHQMIKDEVLDYAFLMPEDVNYDGGKISKGDNYQMLPYVILDYPSIFNKDNIFAVRSMFWWGNFFSITLHLSGKYKTKFISHQSELFQYLKKHNFFICTNNKEWEHHFKVNNYTPALEMSVPQFEEAIEKHFFKIAKKISLTEWDDSFVFFKKGIIEIIQFLQC